MYKPASFVDNMETTSNNSVRPKFKVILLGDSHSGKSSLYVRLKEDRFENDEQPQYRRNINDVCSRLVQVNAHIVEVSYNFDVGIECTFCNVLDVTNTNLVKRKLLFINFEKDC